MYAILGLSVDIFLPVRHLHYFSIVSEIIAKTAMRELVMAAAVRQESGIFDQ